MNQITIKANAKLNLNLNITGIRDDGYHEIDSVFQSIHLFDYISITKANGITLTSNDPSVPLDNSNTCYKMAELLISEYNISGVKIYIDKNIPSSAGLGGASADAAAVLTGINKLFDLNIGPKKLNELGVKIGADVPFFLVGGCAHITGIGQIIKKIDNPFDLDIILIKPVGGVSTPKSYGHFDKTGKLYKLDNLALKAINSNDEKLFLSSMRNDLQKPAFALNDNCISAYNELVNVGALSTMVTGSGSCVFGLFKSNESAYKKVDKSKFESVLKTSFADFALSIIESK